MCASVRVAARAALRISLALATLAACRHHPSVPGHRPSVPEHRPSVPEDSCPVSPDGATLRDPSVLVLVHSFMGHNALAGCELARMLGGRYVRFADSPRPALQPSGRTLAETAQGLSLQGVRRVFLGFPIWGASEPSEPIQHLVASLNLAGIQVVPFSVHMHYADPVAMGRFRDLVRARGGTWTEPILLRVGPWIPPATILRRFHQAVLARRDVWDQAPAPAPSGACERVPAPPGHDDDVLCRVPAGPVWLGDTGSAESPDGYAPPRRVQVRAFAMEQREVTVASYARCVAAGACRPIPYGRSACQQLVGADPTLPTPCAGFDDAQSYCAWAGMRVPTEAEWVRAGRGGELTAYPWGDAFERTGPLRGNFGETPATALPGFALADPALPWPSDGSPGLGHGCQYPAGNSPFGVCDMAGSLGEWVNLERLDSHEPEGAHALLKGGSWLDADPAAFRLAARGFMTAGSSPREITFGWFLSGIRCVL